MSLPTRSICQHLLSVSLKPQKTISCLMSATSYKYEALNITQPAPFVFSVELNRPAKLNALNQVMLTELGCVFSKLDQDPDCRVVVLSGSGAMFSAGVDLADLTQLASIVGGEEDIARKAMTVYQTIHQVQTCVSQMEKCKKPVICCVHHGCVGAGVDMITATDIRLCTEDAWFCVKEVDIMDTYNSFWFETNSNLN